jgi:hypothetical protein
MMMSVYRSNSYLFYDFSFFIFLFVLVAFPASSSAGILEQSMGGPRNRVGIGLSYRPTRLHRLEESIPGLLKSLLIPPQVLRLEPNLEEWRSVYCVTPQHGQDYTLYGAVPASVNLKKIKVDAFSRNLHFIF